MFLRGRCSSHSSLVIRWICVYLFSPHVNRKIPIAAQPKRVDPSLSLGLDVPNHYFFQSRTGVTTKFHRSLQRCAKSRIKSPKLGFARFIIVAGAMVAFAQRSIQVGHSESSLGAQAGLGRHHHRFRLSNLSRVPLMLRFAMDNSNFPPCRCPPRAG